MIILSFLRKIIRRYFRPRSCASKDSSEIMLHTMKKYCALSTEPDFKYGLKVLEVLERNVDGIKSDKDFIFLLSSNFFFYIS